MDRVGDYELLELIGTGGMGEVHRARHVDLGRIVALKTLQPSKDGDPEAVQRFFREIQLSISLRHPSLVRMFDCGTADGVLFLAMECLEGESLEQFLRERGAIPVQDALSITLGVARGLEALHGSRILHRDLKPSNVFLETDCVKLIDFGVSFQLDRTRLTVADGVMGTLEFMAPEVILGGAPSPSGDVWALGCMLYRMLTGRLHVSPNSPGGWLAAILGDPIPPPLELDPAIPPPVSQLSVRLLSRDTSVRPTSAMLVRELEQLVEPGVGRWSFPDLKTARMARETEERIRLSGRPPQVNWVRRWASVAGLVGLVAIALWVSPMWNPGKKLVTPDLVREAHGAPSQAHRSRLWTAYSKHMPALRAGPSDASRNAIRELNANCPLPLGRKPEHWLYWFDLGRWLDEVEMLSGPKPPHRDDAEMDNFEFNIFRNRLLDFDLLRLSDRVDLTVRMVVENPGDGLTWLVLGHQLHLEGREAAAVACFRHALGRTRHRVWNSYPAAVWDSLFQALGTTPGHSLEHEWVNWVLPLEKDMVPWESLMGFLQVRPKRDWHKVLEAQLKDPNLGAGSAWVLGRLYRLIAGESGRALNYWMEARKSFPRSVTLNEEIVRYHLTRGDLEGARPYLAALPPMEAEKYNITQVRASVTHSRLVDVWDRELNVHAEQAFQMVQNGRWTELSRRLETTANKAGITGLNAHGPLYELVGSGRGNATQVQALLDQIVTLCGFAQNPEFMAGPFLDLGFGALTGPRNDDLFARMVKEIEMRWPQTKVAPFLKVVRSSRAGHSVAALDGLEAIGVPRVVNRDVFSPQVAEVLTRAVVHNELRSKPDAALRERIRKLGETLLSGAPLNFWRMLNTGQYLAAIPFAEQLVDQYPGLVEWPLCGVWASALAGDTVKRTAWRNRLSIIVAYSCCGLWALKETDRLPAKSP